MPIRLGYIPEFMPLHSRIINHDLQLLLLKGNFKFCNYIHRLIYKSDSLIDSDNPFR